MLFQINETIKEHFFVGGQRPESFIREANAEIGPSLVNYVFPNDVKRKAERQVLAPVRARVVLNDT
jgi:hypothetical protein